MTGGDLKPGALLIRNFKAFGNPATVVPVAPITLLFGENSSGKSSILQLVHLLVSLLSTGGIEPALAEFRHWGIDLGGFEEFRYRGLGLREDREVFLGFWFPDDLDDQSARPPGVDDAAWQAQVERWDALQEPCLDRPWLGPKSLWLEFGFSDKANPRSPEASQRPSIPVYLSSIELTTPFLSVHWEFDYLTDLFKCRHRTLPWIYGPSHEPRAFGFTLDHDTGVVPAGTEEAPGDPLGAWLLARLGQAVAAARQWLEPMVHLGPKRQNPSPADYSLIEEGEPTSMPAAETEAWRAIGLRGNQELLGTLNQWLGPNHLKTNYEIRHEDSLHGQIRRGILLKLLEPWRQRVSPESYQAFYNLHECVDTRERLLRPGIKALASHVRTCFKEDEGPDLDELVAGITAYFDLFNRSIEGNPATLLVDLRRGADVGFDNVGQGMHNMLPILVQGLASQGTLQLVEQPELHVHPRLQAELGDLFVEAIGRGNRFIVETHSEHLLLRLLKRVRETAENPRRPHFPLRLGDLAIVYVDASGRQDLPEPGPVDPGPWEYQIPDSLRPGSLDRSSRVVPIVATPGGTIVWPGGFFPERLFEIYSQEELKAWYDLPSPDAGV